MTTIRFVTSAGIGAAITFAAFLFVPGVARAEGGGVVLDPENRPRLKSSGEIGVLFGVVPGVVGGFANPALQITPGLSLAVGSSVRYHLTFAYSRLTDVPGTSHQFNGFDVRPLTIGFPVHVMSGDGVGIAIEPLLDLIGMHAYFGKRGAAYLFSSGVGVQGVLNFKRVYVSFAPLNFQFQYAGVGAASGTTLSGGGFGLNMPIRLSAGMRF